jgi:hypothetical protein
LLLGRAGVGGRASTRSFVLVEGRLCPEARLDTIPQVMGEVIGAKCAKLLQFLLGKWSIHIQDFSVSGSIGGVV